MAITKNILPTGRTIKEELRHKWNGIRDLYGNLRVLYPRAHAVAFIVCLGVPALIGWSLAHAKSNDRLLRGELLKQGLIAYSAIEDADIVAEHFADGGEIQKKTAARSREEMQIFNTKVADEYATVPTWWSWSNKASDDRAVVVMWYYQDAATNIPFEVLVLSKAKLMAHEAETSFSTGKISESELLTAEIKYFDEQSELGRLKRVATLCRDEAQSYVLPNHQPPTDQCIFEHNKKRVDRQ